MHITSRVGLSSGPARGAFHPIDGQGQMIPFRSPLLRRVYETRPSDSLEQLLESPALTQEVDSQYLLAEMIALSSDPLRRQIIGLFYELKMSESAVADELHLKEAVVHNHLRRFRVVACEALLRLIENRTTAEAL